MHRGKTTSIDKNVLVHKYFTEHKSTRQIAKELNTTKTRILRNMALHNIVRRESPTNVSIRYGSVGYGFIKAYYLTRIRKHAIQLNLPFIVNSEYLHCLYLEQQGCCAISGCVLTIGYPGSTASLDRIDHTKGYIPDNLQWIHKDLQKMKQNTQIDIFINWCHIISRYNYESGAND